MKLERILERHDDVGTVGFMIYAGTDDKFYSDPELKVPLTIDELGNAFVKGCVINKNGTLYKPTALNADGSLSYGESSGGGSKLYRHDIYFSGFLAGGGMDVWFTIYNSDPTDYSASSEEQKLTAENFAFLPNHDISATGWVGYEISNPDWESPDYNEVEVDCISNQGDYIYMCGNMGQGFAELGFDEEYLIMDTVTEVM